MKKFIGAICSALAGVSLLIIMCFNWYTSNSALIVGGVNMLEGEHKFTGWQILADKDGYLAKTYESGYTILKVFAIIAVVVAVLLILWAIVMLLKNLNVIKCKFNLNVINNVLLTIFAILVIVVAIILVVMGNGYVAEVTDAVSKIPGIEQMKAAGITPTIEAGATAAGWIQLAISVVACGCGWALARKSK